MLRREKNSVYYCNGRPRYNLIPWLASYEISWENKRYAFFFSIGVACNLRACVLLDILYMYCACVDPVFLYTFFWTYVLKQLDTQYAVSFRRYAQSFSNHEQFRIEYQSLNLFLRSDYKLQGNKKFYLLHFVIYF